MDQATAIKDARLRMRMTQQHLAGAANVSKRTVIRIEQGRPVAKESILALCAVLGLDATTLDAPQPPVARTPDSVLADMIAATGEKVVWQGVPDTKSWLRANGMGLWNRMSFFIGATAVLSLAGPIWMHFKERGMTDMGLQYDTTAVALAAAWSALIGLAALRFFLDIRWHNLEAARLERTIHVVTNKAIYVATRDHGKVEEIENRNDAFLGDATRYVIPDDRSLVHARTRSPIWPPAKVVRLDVDHEWGSEKSRRRKVDIAGFEDAEGIVSLIKNGSLSAKAIAEVI